MKNETVLKKEEKKFVKVIILETAAKAAEQTGLGLGCPQLEFDEFVAGN